MVRSVPFGVRITAIVMVVGVALYMLVPLLVVIASSFNTNRFLSFPPEGVTTEWYGQVLTSDTYISPFMTSLGLAVVVAVVTGAVGTGAALAITRFKVPGSAALLSFIMSPIIVPSILLAIGMLAFLSTYANGPTLWGLGLTHAVFTLPYVVRTVSGALARSDLHAEEAARTMGAGWWQRYWLVVLPMARPGIIAGAFFAFNVSFDDAVLALFIRNPSFETLPIAIYGQLEFSPDPSVAAVSSLTILMTIGVLWFIERSLGIGRLFD